MPTKTDENRREKLTRWNPYAASAQEALDEGDVAIAQAMGFLSLSYEVSRLRAQIRFGGSK